MAARDRLMRGYGRLTRVLQAGRGKRVVAFHEVKDPVLFRSKLEWLKENCEVVPLHELLEREVSDRIMISITFDDGYRCWHEHAAPILEALGLHAVFFVCSGFVGLPKSDADRFCVERLRRKQRLAPLGVAELKDLSRHSDFEIGSHTESHVDFSRVFDEATVKREVGRDVDRLQEWTGKRIRFFAYPFGGWPQIVAPARPFVEAAGFEAAFSIIPGFMTQDSNRAAIGRDSLNILESPLMWQSRLGGTYDLYHSIKGYLHRFGR